MANNNTNDIVYLDTYVLQQDMRIRMPKAIITNLGSEKGRTKFDIYLNSSDRSLILREHIDTTGGPEDV